ncbi:hypothetical protein SAMN02745824_1841 [Parasphingorhabdus marina DSM 22363]|uniref:YD repeat-containing protein n=1 Tax=Parasphingorhabdus marina DSM 22363 TaxID=1123272 RepID=A0A1N6DDR0_9SPHN|nr:hypothetical protein [Parasphingorhabdus marina]SIN68912.1 hypothetical protein SAMN02745824_1841 [Parasphingorhabdus marina DSM 22363]
MKHAMLLPLLAIAVAAPVTAQEQTRTVTIDTPRVEGERIITRDREAGTLDRNSELTRKSDGATATSDYNRTRTENGWVASGAQTDFQGRTRSFDYERERTENGFRANGTATGRNGETYNYDAGRRRTENGYVAGRRLQNSDGDTLYSRRVKAKRTENGVSRTVKTNRAAGFKPKRIKPLRPKNLRPRRP